MSTTLVFQTLNPVTETGFTLDQLVAHIVSCTLFNFLIAVAMIALILFCIVMFSKWLQKISGDSRHSKHVDQEHIFIPETYKGTELKLTEKQLAGTDEEITTINANLKSGRAYVVKMVTQDEEGDSYVIFSDFPDVKFLLGSNFVSVSWGH